jgi:hypothetical protein
MALTQFHHDGVSIVIYIYIYIYICSVVHVLSPLLQFFPQVSYVQFEAVLGVWSWTIFDAVEFVFN